MKLQLLIIVCITLAMSCGRARPAGFWANFQKDQLVTNTSDHGPWGGHSAWVWQSDSAVFTDSAVMGFAQKHGWELVDSMSFSQNTAPAINFTSLKADPYTIDLLKSIVLPALRPDDRKIIIFSTGWVAVEPGNDCETAANGFAVLNAAGSHLAIYHHWGE